MDYVFCKLNNIFYDLLASLATDLQLSPRYYKYGDWKLSMLNAQGRVRFTNEDQSRQDIIHVGLQVKCLLFQSHFNQNLDVLKNFS